jgi:ATP-dependent protease ClpP protease subunit
MATGKSKQKTKVDITEKALNLEYALEYGIDFPNRIINICEDVDDWMYHKLDFALNQMEKEGKQKITIRISTYGGEIHSMNQIVARIQRCPRYIQIEGYGKIMSAGLCILACGDKRLLSRFCEVMHHEVSYYNDWAKHKDQKNYIEQTEKSELKRFQLLEDLTGTPVQIWKNLADGPDKYIDPEDCVKLGLVDELF